MTDLEMQCKCIQTVTADRPEYIRPFDLDRCMTDAARQGILPQFKQWLLKQKLYEPTRKRLEAWPIA